MMERSIPSILIGQRRVGLDEGCYVIAEAGSNHNGSLEQAYRLIDVAVEAGADAVKFQIFRASALYPPSAGKSDYLGDERNIFDIIKSMEMPPEWLPKLAAYAREKGIGFMASAFDEASTDMLDPYVDAYKCASYEMTHTPLLRHMASKGKPIVFSTGTASLVEVGEAIEAVRAAGNDQMIVLQCTAAYPAPLESINARALVTMREVFGVLTGLSDHSRDAVAAPVTSVALGAVVIEKHYTLSNRLPGPDHAFALEPHELTEMIRRIREVERTLGTGRKEVHAVEEELRAFARRTVFSSRRIEPGEPLSTSNTIVLRAGKHRHGMSPRQGIEALGRKVTRVLEPYEPVSLEDLAPVPAPAAPTVVLRKAERRDEGRVWVYNDEPGARRVSLSKDPIPWEAHKAWFAARLADPKASLFIVECESEAVGTVRIERRGEEDQISIALTPSARGRGIGVAAIVEAARRHEGELVALVRPDNTASARAFERAGFVQVGSRDVQGTTVSVFVRAARPPAPEGAR
ncbi:GNAT family N-acetyltransferase [Polyangium sp. 15x6]|uniref:GNAT family N-acetyltransferase n=1 Tax=Polyangium sp. 15x6 TaxID=3042687 RepID=UPI00249C08B9|nr:GNAT family N-acetyltransferase [Polyangium sp. 15x6]MDI3286253.1 GNAT family N-acetyltransferase [Polyangium sp. 15x6]